MTLIEVMVSTGLVGLMMVVILAIMGNVGGFVGYFNNQANTAETVNTTVAGLNAALPLITRIQECNCRTASGTRATCLWNPNDPWYDPVYDGGQASPVVLLRGELEAHNGPSTSLANVLGLSSFQGGTCATHNSTLTSGLTRGCKQAFSLTYTAATRPVGTTESKSGRLILSVGSGAKTLQIGDTDWDGMGGIGLSELSCGFDNSAGTSGSGISGAIFVLNMRVKARASGVRSTSNSNYESWYPRSTPTGTPSPNVNYYRGVIREVRMKYSMRNIAVRGVYSWRPESIRNCKVNGRTATHPSQCCSQAMSGGSCVACIPGGGVATGGANSCCSGTLNGGNCQ